MVEMTPPPLRDAGGVGGGLRPRTIVASRSSLSGSWSNSDTDTFCDIGGDMLQTADVGGAAGGGHLSALTAANLEALQVGLWEQRQRAVAAAAAAAQPTAGGRREAPTQ